METKQDAVEILMGLRGTQIDGQYIQTCSLEVWAILTHAIGHLTGHRYSSVDVVFGTYPPVR